MGEGETKAQTHSATARACAGCGPRHRAPYSKTVGGRAGGRGSGRGTEGAQRAHLLVAVRDVEHQVRPRVERDRAQVSPHRHVDALARGRRVVAQLVEVRVVDGDPRDADERGRVLRREVLPEEALVVGRRRPAGARRGVGARADLRRVVDRRDVHQLRVEKAGQGGAAPRARRRHVPPQRGAAAEYSSLRVRGPVPDSEGRFQEWLGRRLGPLSGPLSAACGQRWPLTGLGRPGSARLITSRVDMAAPWRCGRTACLFFSDNPLETHLHEGGELLEGAPGPPGYRGVDEAGRGGGKLDRDVERLVRADEGSGRVVVGESKPLRVLVLAGEVGDVGERQQGLSKVAVDDDVAAGQGLVFVDIEVEPGEGT